MAFTLKVKKRCRFCGTVLREDGTCPNEKCPRYVPDPEQEPTPETPTVEPTEPTQETPATSESEQSSGGSPADTNDSGNTETPTEP